MVLYLLVMFIFHLNIIYIGTTFLLLILFLLSILVLIMNNDIMKNIQKIQINLNIFGIKKNIINVWKNLQNYIYKELNMMKKFKNVLCIFIKKCRWWNFINKYWLYLILIKTFNIIKYRKLTFNVKRWYCVLMNI